MENEKKGASNFSSSPLVGEGWGEMHKALARALRMKPTDVKWTLGGEGKTMRKEDP